MSEFVILGLLGVGVLLFIYALVFKKDKFSMPLFYLLFAGSTFMIPTTLQATYLIANSTNQNVLNSSINTVVVDYLESTSVSFLFIWRLAFTFCLILAFRSLMLGSKKELQDEYERKVKL